jgi:hypothetical protein
MSYWCLFVGPQGITCQSNIGIQSIVMLELGMPTLERIGYVEAGYHL